MDAPLKIGFVALVDCAPLVVAKEAGFFEMEGLQVELKRMSTWTQAYQKLVDGVVDAGHLLSTELLRGALALAEPAPLCTAWVISRGGNAVTVSNALWKALEDGSFRDRFGSQRLRAGVVAHHSPHEYQLREFLRRQSLDPDAVVEWLEIPPQEMVGRMREGTLDLFSAGEPWNQRASTSKLGAIAALGVDLLPHCMEKVLAVRQDWHRAHPDRHARMLRALDRSGRFLSDAANLPRVARWLAADPYVNSVENLILADLRGMLEAGYRRVLDRPDFLVFGGSEVNQPRRADGLRWLEIFTEWGHCPARVLDADFSEILLEGFHASAIGAGDKPIA